MAPFLRASTAVLVCVADRAEEENDEEEERTFFLLVVFLLRTVCNADYCSLLFPKMKKTRAMIPHRIDVTHPDVITLTNHRCRNRDALGARAPKILAKKCPYYF